MVGWTRLGDGREAGQCHSIRPVLASNRLLTRAGGGSVGQRVVLLSAHLPLADPPALLGDLAHLDQVYSLSCPRRCRGPPGLLPASRRHDALVGRDADVKRTWLEDLQPLFS